MKRLEGQPFDQWRDRSATVLSFYGCEGDETCGVFNVVMGTVLFRVIASQGAGWDHVSVSLPARCPQWEEMVEIKRTFFEPEEWACEFHPPPGRNISKHPFCLYLWRPNDGREILTPPTWTIA